MSYSAARTCWLMVPTSNLATCRIIPVNLIAAPYFWNKFQSKGKVSLQDVRHFLFSLLLAGDLLFVGNDRCSWHRQTAALDPPPSPSSSTHLVRDLSPAENLLPPFLSPSFILIDRQDTHMADKEKSRRPEGNRDR
jgi:hypothetical protein